MARYALRWMELNNKPACARMLMTLDSPHQGAYVPLGVMRFIDFFANNELEQNASAQDYAARQLLLMDKSGAPHPWHLSLYNELAQMGYPKATVNVAIASGAKNGGDQGFAAGAKLFEMSGTSNTTIHLGYTQKQFANAKIWSLKDFQSNQVFDGKIGGTIRIYALGLLPDLVPITKKVEETSAQRMGPSNVPSFERVAGGQRPNIAQINRSNFPGWISRSAIHASQSFIPLKSALDIQNSNWYFNAENLRENYPDPILTPFNAIYAAPDNTFHVEISDGALVMGSNRGDNMEFALRYIKNGGSKVGANYNLLTNTYNYGVKSRSQVLHKTIGNGGQLLLYANQADGGGNLPAPQVGETHVYSFGTGGCSNDILTVANGGVLDVGDATANNKAIFNIRNAATLKIENGGSLQVADNSKLIIQDGSNLIFENGASIDLQGPNAQLVIQGKLTVAPNTNFTFTGAGKLVFDQNIPWVQNAQGNLAMDLTNFMEIGANATFKLSNPSLADKYDVLLECRQSALLKDALGNAFTEVAITNGTVELEQNAFLFSFGKTDIVDAAVNSTGYNKTHGGIRIWNSGNINRIRRTDFRRGMPGVLYHGFGQSGRVEISNCLFTQNQTSVKVDGGNFRITQSNFNYNTGPAVEGDALSATSIIGTSIFDNLTSTSTQAVNAIHLVGQQGSMLNLSNNQIKGYAQAVHVDNVDINATCNTIEHNSIGLQAFDALVYMQEEASNTFRHNSQTNVDLIARANGHGIFLRDGHNFFDKDLNSPLTFAHVAADYDCYMPLSDYRSGGMILDFNYNNFVVNPVSQGQLNFFPIQVAYCNPNSNLYANLNVDYSINNQSSPTCNSQNPNGNEGHPLADALNQFAGFGGKVSSPGFFSDYPLVNAVLQAVDSLDEDERNDLWALQQFNAILTGSFSVQNSTTEAILNLAYQGAFLALNNAYTWGQLTHNGEEPQTKPAVLANFEAIIQSRIEALNPADSLDHNLIFKYNLDKVQAARVGGYYADALNRLAATDWQFNYTQSQRKGYWQCVCEAENQYYQGGLPEEEFAYELQACRTTFAGYSYKRAQEARPRTLQEVPQALQVFPQPVKSEVNVQLKRAFNGEVKISIRSTSGALVFSETYQWQGAAKTLNLAGLAPGVYLLEFTSKEYHEVVKLIKE